MKKAISLIFALLLGLMLVACGEKETSEEVKQESGIQVQTQQSNNSSLTFSKSASIEKAVIYDQDNIRITANGLTYTNYGAEIEFAFENNTDADLSFISGSLGYSCNAVNGYMMQDGYFYCDVPAGKQAIDSLCIGYESMLLCGINEIRSIQIGIDISDENYEDVYIAPIELLTSAQGGSDFGFYESVQSADLQNELGIKVEKSYQENISLCSGVAALSEVVLTGTSDSQILLLEIENQTNEAVYVSADRIAVNGLIVESNTWTGDIINAGKRDLLAIELEDIMDGSSLQSYGITEAGEVSLRLVAEDLQNRELGQVQFTMPIIDGAKRVTASGGALYDKNGIRVYAGAMAKDTGSYSKDIHIFLLVENGSGAEVSVSDVYNSLSLNGYMADYFCPFVAVPNGAIAELDISISEDDAEKIGIISETDIHDMEMKLSIEDEKYRKIDEPAISLAW